MNAVEEYVKTTEVGNNNRFEKIPGDLRVKSYHDFNCRIKCKDEDYSEVFDSEMIKLVLKSILIKLCSWWKHVTCCIDPTFCALNYAKESHSSSHTVPTSPTVLKKIVRGKAFVKKSMIGCVFSKLVSTLIILLSLMQCTFADPVQTAADHDDPTMTTANWRALRSVPVLDNNSSLYRDLQADHAFTFDFVITWVNSHDIKWRQKFESFGYEFKAERFAPSNEIQLSLTAMSKFARWVKNIYIVTDDQQFDLSFISDNDFRRRIRFVDHKEIIPSEYLPLFNSHAIEGYLHKINGLSEYFIYFNDDMMIGRPISPYGFFVSQGAKLIIPLVKSLYVVVNCLWLEAMPEEDKSHSQVVRNTQLLFKKHFGYCQSWVNQLHYPYVMKKSFLAKASEIYKKYWDKLSKNRVRSYKHFQKAGDFMPLLLAQYVGVDSGEAEFSDTAFTIRYVGGSYSGIINLCHDSYDFITIQNLGNLKDEEFKTYCTCLLNKICSEDTNDAKALCVQNLTNTTLCTRQVVQPVSSV